jgi:formate--tetrahydrofolate ligase
MPVSGLRPDLAVLIASVRALATQGSANERGPADLPALRGGLPNLGRHIDNLRKFQVPIVVAINRFPGDAPELLGEIAAFCAEKGVECATTDAYDKGGEGAIELAEKVLCEIARQNGSSPAALQLDMSPFAKIETIARESTEQRSV